MIYLLLGIIIGGVLVFRFRSQVGAKVDKAKAKVKELIKDSIKDD